MWLRSIIYDDDDDDYDDACQLAGPKRERCVWPHLLLAAAKLGIAINQAGCRRIIRPILLLQNQ